MLTQKRSWSQQMFLKDSYFISSVSKRVSTWWLFRITRFFFSSSLVRGKGGVTSSFFSGLLVYVQLGHAFVEVVDSVLDCSADGGGLGFGQEGAEFVDVFLKVGSLLVFVHCRLFVKSL